MNTNTGSHTTPPLCRYFHGMKFLSKNSLTSVSKKRVSECLESELVTVSYFFKAQLVVSYRPFLINPQCMYVKYFLDAST